MTATATPASRQSGTSRAPSAASGAGGIPMQVVGIDAGGTKTVCCLADGDGSVIGEARSGGANLQSEGELGVEKVLHTVMDRAVDGRVDAVDAICLGMVILGGPGPTAYGRNARDQAARAGGWGHILGDEGSGYWIGRQALRSVGRGARGRGP